MLPCVSGLLPKGGSRAKIDAMACSVDDLELLSVAALDALGLDPIPMALTTATIPLWQGSSAGGKYHRAGVGSGCRYIRGRRQFSESDKPLPANYEATVIDFTLKPSQLCAHCAHTISIPSGVDTAVKVLAELIRAANWKKQGLRGIGEQWSWLEFARWKSRRPLVGDHWRAQVKSLRSKGWSQMVLHLLDVSVQLNADAEDTEAALIANIDDDPRSAALLARAVCMVETESQAIAEAKEILAFSGCPREPEPFFGMPGRVNLYKQVSPWRTVSSLWVHAHKEHAMISLERLDSFLDSEFPHVHDVSALGCTQYDIPYQPGDCIHSWAARFAQARRREIVHDWVRRLDLAHEGLIATTEAPAIEATHLLCIPGWPLTDERLGHLSYLTQFEIACGPISVNDYPDDPLRAIAVLRVPAWAAAHATELPGNIQAEQISTDPMQAVLIARMQGAALVCEEFNTARRKPSRAVSEERDHLHSRTAQGLPQNSFLRPLAAGASPFGPYHDESTWTQHSAWWALGAGTAFVYGWDDLDLLAMALPRDHPHGLRGTLHVEVQTSCQQYGHSKGPHICQITGFVNAVHPNGTCDFTPSSSTDRMFVPAPYIAGITSQR